MKVISDTTVISNFASIGEMSLLQRLYDRLYIPVEVYDEIVQGLREGYGFYRVVEPVLSPLCREGWIEMVSLAGEAEIAFLGSLPTRLGRGEASCLSIAKHRKWLLLTDDKAAREEARKHGVPVSGSVGSLVLAVERKHCSLHQANRWLEEMIRQGYRSPMSDMSVLVEGKR